MLETGRSVMITALALEDITEPTWEIQELKDAGYLSKKGMAVTYTAPSIAGTYHLIASANRPDGSKVRQVIEVVVLPSITIEPTSPVLHHGATMQFVAEVKGLQKNAVKWSVASAESGSITADGLYTAPQKSGVYQVIATSAEYPSASASVNVRVD